MKKPITFAQQIYNIFVNTLQIRSNLIVFVMLKVN